MLLNQLLLYFSYNGSAIIDGQVTICTELFFITIIVTNNHG